VINSQLIDTISDDIE